MPGFFMDIVKNTRKYITEKLGFAEPDYGGEHPDIPELGSSRKRGIELIDFGYSSSPKSRRISESFLREPGSIFMPDTLASETTTRKLPAFMDTLSSVKKFNDSELFPSFERSRLRNSELEDYSSRIDQALKNHTNKVAPFVFAAPNKTISSYQRTSNIPDLHPINRSVNQRRSLGRPRLTGVTKRYSNGIMNQSQSANPKIPSLMQSLFSEPKTTRMSTSNSFTMQNNINSIVKQYEKNLNRQKYERLLQTVAPQLYSEPITTANTSSFVNRRKSLLPPKEIIDLDDLDDQQPSTSIRQRQNRKSNIRNEIDTIDLSSDPDLAAIMARFVNKQHDTKQTRQQSTDEPIEIIEIPDVEPVNTLKNKLETRPKWKEDLVPNTEKRYSDRRNQRTEQISNEKENLKKLQRDSIEHAQFMTERFKSFAIDDVIIVLDEEEEKEEVDEYPSLTNDHQNLLRHALVGRKEEVIVSKFNMNITRGDLNTLVGANWLNDEVINFYMNLLVERSEKRSQDGYPKVYCMNTFFIPKLLQSGHGSLRRWTRKVDIFAHDVIPVPVHVGEVHWCMAIIHMKNKTIKYYDSMGKPNDRVLDALEQYLKDECMDKKQEKFDLSGWEKVSVPDCPRQMNGSDCGVFSCMNAEFITRDSSITFSQKHMPYFRQKMVCEIAAGQMWL